MKIKKENFAIIDLFLYPFCNNVILSKKGDEKVNLPIEMLSLEIRYNF